MFDNYKIVFWDFDGVIKESVEVKTNAFRDLFQSFGEEVMEKVTMHHINNGGMSRYKKIPIYLSYAGIQPTENIINEFCN
jgi:beta-phosphoglucomutase-like phosphatase (HAD superfamily)